MSYILNALKKAEHDRKREEPEDLDDFVSAGWDPYEQRPRKSYGYKLATIIVAIAMLLFYGFYNLTNKNDSDAVLISEPLQAVEIPQVVAVEVIPQSVEPRSEPVVEEFAEEPVLKELQLPEVTIAGHIYIRSGSEKNRIFIGDRTYYVGDSIDSNWVIESINFDSLSIRSGNLSSEIPLR
ncbi:MAG: hypothetical protein ACPGF6_04865 [Porticoccaceae bacterium]